MKIKFSTKVLRWFNVYGRKNLPWQQNISPYHTWVSEIMLQQTQVATVIPYYDRFLKDFPSVTHLAKAPLEKVLANWSGLGYYARARHLHRTAQLIQQQYQGIFPNNLDDLTALPGIGRSTAGAILSIAFEQPAAILDGNVKRILCRHFGIEGLLTKSKTINTLWELAEQLLPTHKARNYTQAMMDLGALICTRTQPDCQSCPLKSTCFAFNHNKTELLPTKGSKKNKPMRLVRLLIIQYKNKFLLQQRPSTGIWGSLFSFPEYPIDEQLTKLPSWLAQQFDIQLLQKKSLTEFIHQLTHFHLQLTPWQCEVDNKFPNTSDLKWVTKPQAMKLGLPAPIKKLIINTDFL